MKKYPIIDTMRDEYYVIHLSENEPSIMYRRFDFYTPENPLSADEIIIIALCDKIMRDMQ